MKGDRLTKNSREWDDYDVVLSYYDSNSSCMSEKTINIESQSVANERMKNTNDQLDGLLLSKMPSLFLDTEKYNQNDDCINLRNACSNVNEISVDSEFLTDGKSLVMYNKDEVPIKIPVKNKKKAIVLREKTTEDDNIGFDKKVNIIKMDIKFKNDITAPRTPKNKSILAQKILNDEPSEIVNKDVISAFKTAVDNETRKQRDISRPSKKFVFGKTSNLKHIKNVDETYEFKYGEIYDKLIVADEKGKTTENYVKLLENEMLIFNSAGVKVKNLLSAQNENRFIDPIKQDLYYDINDRIDLLNAKIYLNTEFKGFFGRICCCGTGVEKIHLIDISEIILDDVIKEKSSYIIKYRINTMTKRVRIQNLEFIIEHNNKLYSFRCKDDKIYMNWVVSVLLRHGRELCYFN